LNLIRQIQKITLRQKWYDSDNATLQMALMRLVCTDDERRKLAINYTELTAKDGKNLAIGGIFTIAPVSTSVILISLSTPHL